MAIDKSRTSTSTKTVIIIIAVAFALLAVIPAISSIVDGSGAPNTNGTSGTAATGTGAVSQISQQKLPAIQSAEQQLTAKPKDYALLKQLGDAYYDYAYAVKGADPNSGVDRVIWARSVDYYQRALAVNGSDPNVATDMAISQYYSGDPAAAVTSIEKVRKASPKFAPAIFNSGIFYRALGDNAKATAAFNDYLKVDPNGPNVANAKKFLGEIKSSGPAPASGTTSGTGK